MDIARIRDNVRCASFTLHTVHCYGGLGMTTETRKRMDPQGETHSEKRRLKMLFWQLNAVKHDYSFLDLQPAMNELEALIEAWQE
jgi:hypothetical protein